MKLLLVTFSLLSFFSAFAGIEDLTFEGQLRLRNENKELSHTDSSKRNTTQMRVRASVEGRIASGLRFRVTPQATKDYGEIITPSNDASDSKVYSSGDQYHTSLDLFEGYVESGKADFKYKLGRQTLAYGNNLILGTRNWTAGGLAFDAIKLSWQLGEGKLDAVYSQVSQGLNSGTTNDDVDLTFLYWEVIKKQRSKELDFYIIHNNDSIGTESLSMGLRYYFRLGKLDFRTENIGQKLSASSLSGTEFISLSELGYQISESTRGFLGYSQASESYQQLYVNRHFYNGVIDILGFKNLKNYNIGSIFQLNSKVKIALKHMVFKQTEVGAGVYNLASTSALSGDIQKKDVGSELDIIATYTKSENESFRLGLSCFDHGEYFSKGLSNSNFGYLQYFASF